MNREDTELLRTLRRPVEELLAMGGDSRLLVDSSSGLSRYGCATRPRPGTVSFGSCTAGSISSVGFDAACRLHRRLLASDDEAGLAHALRERLEAVRDELLFSLTRCEVPGVEVVLTPSGTDAELLALALCRGSERAPVSNVLIGPAEVGSGTPFAAAARHFDTMTPNGYGRHPGDPVDEELAAAVELVEVRLRDDDGAARALRELDAEVESLVDERARGGRRVLLHVVAHSKTGLHAPSLAAVERLRERYPRRVMVVIDAAQGRFTRRDLVEALSAGYLVVVTGSKFYGGPPFCGALLVPPGASPERFGPACLPGGFRDYFTANQMPRAWRALRGQLPTTDNAGLLLRWTSALAEMREYYATPAALRLRVLKAFEHLAPGILARSRHIEVDSTSPAAPGEERDQVLPSRPTVFSFSVHGCSGARLDVEALRRIWRSLNVDASDLVAGLPASEQRALKCSLHTGQPVVLTRDARGPAVLRIAIGGVLVTQIAQDPEWGARFEDRLLRLEGVLHSLTLKLEAIVRNDPEIDDGETLVAESRRAAS